MKKQDTRNVYTHEGRVIYEWEEGLESINLWIEAPRVQGVKLSEVVKVEWKANWLSVGLKGNPPYISEQTQGIVDTDETLWYMEEKDKKHYIVVEIQKAQKAMNWGCVFKGHQSLDPLQQEQLKKKMMLERFQQEHPGFDFSNADFNGQVPDARTFMGGMKNN